MQCPACQNVTLIMSERSGIEIDYCNQCRGVWLDRGELDKIIDRNIAAAPINSSRANQPLSNQNNQPSPYSQYHPQSYQGHYKQKKHKSFLSEIFDFD